jgi:D-serine deaminase-like pyridoxal phosphate-dependent protein
MSSGQAADSPDSSIVDDASPSATETGGAPSPTHLDRLFTPSLVLDEGVLENNIAKMADRCRALGVALRPHIKTPKSSPIAQRLRDAGATGFAASTLAEAEWMAAWGSGDIFYAAPLSASKVERASALRKGGADVSFLTDNLQAIVACGEAAAANDVILPFWIEIDVDGYRTGIELDHPDFTAIARLIDRHPNLTLAGLMSYGGASYGCSPDEARDLSETHRQALLRGQAALRQDGIDCDRLSFGSTPAVLHAATMSGITEVRCGIFVFQDLFQAGIGACAIEDIAVSVLTTVIGVNPGLNRVTIDAGGMALSKDRSTQGRSFDAAFGLVCDIEGALIPDLHVQTVSQELGLVTSRSGAPIPLERLRVGAKLRILPNHADMTAAAYDRYHVVRGSTVIRKTWARKNGW